MGSSAIKGMPGTPMVDICIELSEPITEKQAKTRAYVEFVEQDKESFDTYAKCKLDGWRLAKAASEAPPGDGPSPYIQYKIHKSKVVEEIMAKAKAWKGLQ